MKIRAYTLMEVTVAMLISAICITICYTAYGIVGRYYQAFTEKNELADQLISLKQVMQVDFLKSKIINRNNQGFECIQDSSRVLYKFNENEILRSLGEQHTDTFNLQFAELKTYFERSEVIEPDTIDQVRFTIFLIKKTPVNILLHKNYSSQDLFK